MRPILIILIIALVFLQHKLWLGDGNLVQFTLLQHKLTKHEEQNNKLIARNKALEADIEELKRGDQALEEEARHELGMIKENEVFYQFVD
jgi:cell division protein FtsB